MNRQTDSIPSCPAPRLTLSRAVRSTVLSALLGSALCAGSALAQAPQTGSSNGTPLAPAATPRQASFGQPFRDADLIFEGVVESLRYRNSDVRNAGDISVPNTFVTFRVERVFKGGIAGSTDGTLTLRFLGGTDGSGRTLHVSHAPRFEVGSREILLVQNSETWGIPLVGGDQRRFQIVDERVLSEGGNAIEFAGGRVRVRPSDKANEADVEIARTHSMPGDVFRATLENLIRQNHSAEEFFATAPVTSVVFEQPFFVPMPGESAPQVRAADLAEPVLDPESRR